MIAAVHVFAGRVALFTNGPEPVYLTARDAETVAQALDSAAHAINEIKDFTPLTMRLDP